MGTITGLTAERMLAIEAASVVDGDIVGDELFLTKHDGSVLSAGNVRGPIGPEGPRGSNLAAVSALAVSDVGIINQIRAGRQLTPADFTNMGLSVPIGLWNLSNLNDASGNGRTLVNKGAVASAVGINGVASTAMQFSGAPGQALYIADVGGADPFRIKTGSWGAWFRMARRGTQQYILAKMTGTSFAFGLSVLAGGQVYSLVSIDGTTGSLSTGISDAMDDRWHFAVATFDGSLSKIYLDGVIESSRSISGVIFSAAAPFNIGGRAADASVGTTDPNFGRVDEAFVTSDILSEEQVRNLYCASIPHTLGSSPSSYALSVRRRRRGSALATTDFPAQPVRLYNFTGGAVTDQGSGNVPLGPAGTPAPVVTQGADGSRGNGYALSGSAQFFATDAGLPALLTSRSFGGWFRTNGSGSLQVIMSWGTVSTGDTKLYVNATTGILVSANGADAVNGPFVADGQWHFVVSVEDNAAVDGKRKTYLDGRLVMISTVLNSIALAGSTGLRVGANTDGGLPLQGGLDSVFIFAGALTLEQIRKLYDVGSQVLAPSPKAPADHVEASEAGRLLAIFDTIESSDSIDLAVMA